MRVSSGSVFAAKNQPVNTGSNQPQLRLVQTADTVALRFGQHLPHKKGVGWLGRLVMASALALGGLVGLVGRPYIQQQQVPNPHELYVDSFLRNAEGIQIRYYAPNDPNVLPSTLDEYHEIEATPELEHSLLLIKERVLEVLGGRPDLLEALENFPNGLDIRIYNVSSIYDMPITQTDGRPDNLRPKAERSAGFVRANPVTQEVVIGFSQPNIAGSLNIPNDGYDVITHEIAGHIVDSLEFNYGQTYVVGTDGILPGLSDTQLERYKHARDVEKQKIADEDSILPAYALKNNNEFLAKSIEVLFERPGDMQKANPELYDVLTEYFNVDPHNLKLPGDTDLDINYQHRPNPLVPSLLIIAGSIFFVYGGHAVIMRARRKEEI